jgi:hypothetical protein
MYIYIFIDIYIFIRLQVQRIVKMARLKDEMAFKNKKEADFYYILLR